MMLASLLIALSAGPVDTIPAWAPFLGRWVGEGTANGSAVHATAEWSSQSGGNSVRLDMQFGSQPGDPPMFSGRADYNTRSTAGQWSDSQGASYVLTHRIIADTLLVTWTMPSGSQAESRYVAGKNGTLHETSALVGADGSRRPFLQFSYRRDPKK